MLTIKPKSGSRNKGRGRKVTEDLSFILGLQSKRKESFTKSSYFSSFNNNNSATLGQSPVNAQSQQLRENGENFGWRTTTISSVPQLVTAAQSRAVLGREGQGSALKPSGWKMCSSAVAFRNPQPATNNDLSFLASPFSNNNGSSEERSSYFEKTDKTPMRFLLDQIQGPDSYNPDDPPSGFVLQSPWVSRDQVEPTTPRVILSSPTPSNQPILDSTNYSVQELIDIMCGDAVVESLLEESYAEKSFDD